DGGPATIDPTTGASIPSTIYTINAAALQGSNSYAAPALAVGVIDVAPTIAVTGADSVDEGATYSLNLGAITDPGVLDHVTQIRVNWGDGSIFSDGTTAGTTNYQVVNGPGTANYVVDTSGKLHQSVVATGADGVSLDLTHRFKDEGPHFIQVSLVDQDG